MSGIIKQLSLYNDICKLLPSIRVDKDDGSIIMFMSCDFLSGGYSKPMKFYINLESAIQNGVGKYINAVKFDLNGCCYAKKFGVADCNNVNDILGFCLNMGEFDSYNQKFICTERAVSFDAGRSSEIKDFGGRIIVYLDEILKYVSRLGFIGRDNCAVGNFAYDSFLTRLYSSTFSSKECIEYIKSELNRLNSSVKFDSISFGSSYSHVF